MGFFEKIRRFTAGRYVSYGVDALNIFLVVIAALTTFIMSLAGLRHYNLISLVLYVPVIWRLLSRNIEKRRAENEVFLRFFGPVKSFVSEKYRQKSDADHRYYKCPQCKRVLRVPRIAVR